ncbi:hypothetical protein JCM3765_004068 [Sporobolomyces pararoseus]
MMLMRTTSFSPPLFSPVPSPPPPSPSSSNSRIPQRSNSKRAVFDIVSSSPQSFDGQEKTILKARLERSRKLRIAVKPGVPARLLSDKEADSTTSSSGVEQGSEVELNSESNGVKAKEGKGKGIESPSSPWITDSDPPTRTSTPVNNKAQKSSKLVDSKGQKEKVDFPTRRINETTKIQGFEIQSSSQQQHPPAPPRSLRPPFSRVNSETTSSLSLLLARTQSSTELSLPPASPIPAVINDGDAAQQTSIRPAGRTWNGDIVAETLASQSRAVTPSTSPSVSASAQSSPPRSLRSHLPCSKPTTGHSLSSSASLPSLARTTESKRTRFLTSSASLTTTPSSSPPKSASVLQFTRRPTCVRQSSMAEGFPRFGRQLARVGSTLSQRDSDSGLEETEVEEDSEYEELQDFNRFQPSIFASHYSNSATSLSSASSSIVRTSSSISSSPKSTRGFELATSAPNVSVAQTSPDPSTTRRVSSEPKRVNLQDLRRQQLERKEKSLKLDTNETSEEGSTPRPGSKQGTRRAASAISPTSMPHLQLPWKKLFSLS